MIGLLVASIPNGIAGVTMKTLEDAYARAKHIIDNTNTHTHTHTHTNTDTNTNTNTNTDTTLEDAYARAMENGVAILLDRVSQPQALIN